MNNRYRGYDLPENITRESLNKTANKLYTIMKLMSESKYYHTVDNQYNYLNKNTISDGKCGSIKPKEIHYASKIVDELFAFCSHDFMYGNSLNDVDNSSEDFETIAVSYDVEDKFYTDPKSILDRISFDFIEDYISSCSNHGLSLISILCLFEMWDEVEDLEEVA